MIILGIDPGTGRTGYGVVEEKDKNIKMVASGCIETRADNDDAARLVKLYNRLNELFDKYKPDYVALESLFFAKNIKTAMTVGQARGIVLLVSCLQGRKVYTYAPLEVKLAVTGYGKADKKQVQRMTKEILHLSEVPKPDDVADALAIALTHCFSRKMKNLGIKSNYIVS